MCRIYEDYIFISPSIIIPSSFYKALLGFLPKALRPFRDSLKNVLSLTIIPLTLGTPLNEGTGFYPPIKGGG